MKYAKFVLQLLIAVVLISSNIAPSIVMADELEQVAEQQQQAIVNEAQAAPTNTQDTTPEQTEGTTDFSEQNPNQYAVFDITTTVKGPTGNNIVSSSAGKMSVAEGTTALDAVKQLLDSKGIAYEVVEGSFGPYIQSINGEAEKKFGGWDGWSYTVNGESPDVGLASYVLKKDDKVEVYYSTYPDITSDSVVSTQTATIVVNIKGDQFRTTTLSQYVSSNGIVTLVTLDEARQQATITLKLRDVEAITDETPLTLTVKSNATISKKEQSITIKTADTITKDEIVTYKEEEVRQQAEAALQKSKAFMQQNVEALSKGTSSSYSGFWKTAALVAAGIDPSYYQYASATSPYAEGSDWLKPVDKAFTPVNTNAGYVLGAIHLDLDPTNLKTRNFVDDLAKQQKEDGSFGAINNEAFALLALDLAGAKYDQEKHIQAILKMQDETGIFPAWGSLDSTGWALMALAPHKEREDVAQAIERAVNGLHASYIENGVDNANTAAAFISGLGSVGENIFSDKWTDWQGRQLVQHFIADYQLETGEFLWKATDTAANAMATEQAIIALGDVLNGYSSFSKQALDNVRSLNASVAIKGPTGGNIVREEAIKVADGATALDAVKQLLDSKGIAYEVVEGSFGPYIQSINGEAEKKFGGWDGWMYTVNGEAPEVGLASYVLKKDDKVEVYYSTYPVFTSESIVDTQTADVIVNVKGDQFRSNATTLTNWVSSNGVVKAVTLDESMQQATVTLKLRDVESKEPLILTVKPNATIGKQEATIPVETTETITTDEVVTYTEEEIRKQAEAALQKSKAYLQSNAELVSKSISSSYSGFWKTAGLVAVGIYPAKYPYAKETSPYAEGSDWLKPIDAANAAVNTNAGYVLGAIHLGLDPTNLKTRNIVEDLLSKQGESGAFGLINNDVFALLALDLAGAKYDQEKHLQAILSMQDETGIFPAWGSLDSTGWALMALAPHKEREDVAQAIERAVNALHASYIENGVDNANTAAAFISGLGSVGENIFSEKWTDWQGRQLVQHFIADYQLETGEFLWKATDTAANAMATEQAIIALGDVLNGYSSFSKQALDNVRKTIEEPVEVPEQPTEPEQPTNPTQPEMPEQPTQPTTPEQPAQPTNPEQPTSQTMTVSVSITGLQSIVEQQAVTLPKEATALDALQAVAAANGVSVSIRSTTYGLYVEGINGLMEMQYGKTSGWMYSVNGSFPERSADKELVSNGDVIAWSYTYDESTVGNETPSNPSPSLPSNPSQPSQPSQPSTPEQPVTPEQPTTPEQPVTPEEPTEPETPVTPEEPTEPETPVTPEEPTEPEAPVTLPFTDIEPTNYSAPYIAKLYELGITTGTTDTTFSPKANLTRSQFAVMIARALKLEPKGAPKFKDVQGKWYADAVQALVENGIVQGVDENTFAPGNTITRQQTAVMLFRVLQFAGYDALADVPTFNDAANISPYAQQAFATLQKLNILTGNEGFANPHEQLTRQQMAKLLVLTLEAIQK